MNVSPGSEHASGSEYANILDILEFWICVWGSEYTRNLNISGLHRALNVPKYFFDISDHVWICLNMAKYAWIFLNILEYAQIYVNCFFDMSDHVWICLNMTKYAWIFLNILEYAQIYVNCFCFTCLHLIPCLLERSYFFHIYKFIFLRR